MVRIPISEQTRQEVIAKWLSGWGRDKIADELCIGAGTVTNIVTSWNSETGIPTAEALRMFSVEIKRYGISVRECARGFRLLRHLQGLEGDEEIKQIDIFLSKVYDKSKYYNLPPERLVEIASEIWELSKIMPTSNILAHLSEKVKEKENLDDEIKRLNAEKDLIAIDYNRLLHLNKTTAELLKQYVTAREYYTKYGLDIDNIGKFATVLQNAENYRFDLNQIVEKISSNKSLAAEEQELQDKIWREREQLRLTQDHNKLALKEVDENLAKVNENLAKVNYCNDLGSMGFGMNEFIILKSILVEISETENENDSGSNSRNLVKMFFRKVDEMRNLETRIQFLRKEADRIEELYKSLSDSIKRSVEQANKGIKEMSEMAIEAIKLAYQKSKEKGVSDNKSQNPV